MVKKKIRTNYDWETIKREYRVGQFSNAIICRMFKLPESTLRSRAKRKGWTRDLASRVQKRIKEKLSLEDKMQDGDTTRK